MPLFLFFGLAALALPLLHGCFADDPPVVVEPSAPAAMHVQQARQLILKFKDGRGEAMARASVARLAQVAGVELTYLRPMAGQAHVLRFSAPVSAEQIEQALHALQSLPEIEYAERDLRGMQP